MWVQASRKMKILALVICFNLYGCVQAQSCEGNDDELRQFLADNDKFDPHPCPDAANVSQKECGKFSLCFWHAGSCRRKPVRCYVDYRKENCPVSLGYSGLKGIIHKGFSLNNSHCFVWELKDLLGFKVKDSPEFNVISQEHGVPILSDANGYLCSTESYYYTTVGHKGCTSPPRSEVVSVKVGYIWANHCVHREGKKEFRFPLAENGSCHCMCKMVAWLASRTEKNGSCDIQKYIESRVTDDEGNRIIERIIRTSWKERVNVLNITEAELMISSLVEISTNRSINITVHDAENLLENSRQLAVYKFYEGMENNSAKTLIMSATTMIDNLITRLTIREPGNYKSQRGDVATTIGPITVAPSRLESSNVFKEAIESLEQIAENVATHIELKDRQTYEMAHPSDNVNIKISVAGPENSNVSDLFHNSSQKDQVAKIKHVLTNGGDFENGNFAVISIFYSDKEDKELNQTSDVLVVNARHTKLGLVENVSVPVEYKMKTKTHGQLECGSHRKYGCYKRSCQFQNYQVTNNSDYTWDSYGCHVKHVSSSITVCECNHTTHFAVLMYYQKSPFTDEMEHILEIMSIMLGCLSCLCLVITIAIFLKYRAIVLKDRMVIHFHMIVALLGGYISFMCSALFTAMVSDNWTGCFISAILMHYFFLCCFFWFLVEGVYLFYKIVHVFKNKNAEILTKHSWAVGWVVPLVIVTISVIVARIQTNISDDSQDAYFFAETCFLQIRNGMIWAFMGPACTIIAINTLILIKVLTVIFRSSYTASMNARNDTETKVTESLRKAAKGAAILLPILGIPWIINLFSINSSGASFVAAVMHVILMGTQGICIFVFYCIYNSEIKNARLLSEKRKKSILSVSSNNGGRKKSRIPLIGGTLPREKAANSPVLAMRSKSIQ